MQNTEEGYSISGLQYKNQKSMQDRDLGSNAQFLPRLGLQSLSFDSRR